MRLLLVEDNEINRKIAAMLLSEFGFTLDTAVNGREAVEQVAVSDPGYYDAVLMEIQMPVMNGYKATRAIRALPAPARDAGMDGHIAKPIDMAAMIKTLTEVLWRSP